MEHLRPAVSGMFSFLPFFHLLKVNYWNNGVISESISNALVIRMQEHKSYLSVV